jgi:phospholipid N-methyltransferase
MRVPPTTRLQDRVLLVSRFLRHPRSVGAFAPSSRALAEAMCAHLVNAGGQRVVELGPGTGALTGGLIERLDTTSRLLAVEIDPFFVATMRRRWPQLDVACASAEDLPDLLRARGLHDVDHIVSGLPFVSLPAPVVERTLRAIEVTLAPAGTFTTFQYLHCFGWPSAVTFRRAVSRRLASGAPSTRKVLANAPPAVVLRWVKGAAT